MKDMTDHDDGRILRWEAEVPPLRRPVLIVSLDGFIDAGNAAATAAMFLRHRWQAESVATFDRDTFLDYRARRPTTVVDAGVVRRVRFDELQLLAAPVTDAIHDALFLIGPEPDMRWESFCNSVVNVVEALQVETTIVLGAYPAAAPHTRPVNVVCARNIAAGDLVPTATSVPGYTGPIGAGVVLMHRLGEAGHSAIGLWAEVPHYISANNHPASGLALVLTVAATFGVGVDTTELEAAVHLHHEQVDAAVEEHEDAAEMIATLEAHMDRGGDAQDIPSGDDLAEEIERFLSDRRD